MIENWKISGFKSIASPVDIELGSGAILCGANSSGKSSILQTILLLSQSCKGMSGESSVLLNGRLVQLGGFSEIKSDCIEENKIKIGMTINVDSLIKSFEESELYISYMARNISELYSKISFDLEFGFIEEATDSVQDLSPKVLFSRLAGVRRDGTPDDFLESNYCGDSRDELSDSITPLDFSKFEEYFEVSVKCSKSIHDEVVSTFGNSAKISGMTHRAGLPLSAVIVYDSNQKRSDTFASFVSGVEGGDAFDPRMGRAKFSKDAFLNALSEIVVELGDDPRSDAISDYYNKVSSSESTVADFRLKRESLDKVSIKNRDTVIEVLESMHSFVRESFLKKLPRKHSLAIADIPLLDSSHLLRDILGNKIKYLGPLRDSPRAIYPLSADPDPKNMGLKGEFTAAVFNRFKDYEIEYISPESVLSNDIDIKKNTLTVAVQEWLAYLGVVESLDSQFIGKHGYEMAVRPKNSNQMHDLTHVGVGVSQVLPIVVMSLLSKKGDFFVFEQPELHLHPKVQSRLGDFFICLGLMRRQIIVETHSEYLIDKLRLRIAKDRDDEILERSNIYFAEVVDGNTRFVKIKINEYGSIVNWPDDFFDESMLVSQEIIAAATEKKFLKRKK